MTETKTIEPRRIVEIEVEGLFGTFDHRIPLNLDERITIVHGPNGFGKTVLLKMLYAFGDKRFAMFEQVPFKKFRVRVDDGIAFEMTKVQFDLQLVRNDKDKDLPAHFSSTFRLAMIHDQRLVNGSDPDGVAPSPGPAVIGFSQELVDSIRKRLAESVALSQSLDSTFPTRLVQRMQNQSVADAHVAERLKQLEAKRATFREVGLLDEQEGMEILPTPDLKPAQDVLSVYVEDAEKKLGVFDDLANKIALFKDIVNSRFLYKELHISRQEGFVFTSDTGETVPLDALSSGEQHEIVLFYQLLFRIEPDTLVLIDEPELSLHVAWQRRFLDDLVRVTRLVPFDVLIATHSPQIINDRWDLTVELKGPEELETRIAC